MRPIICVSDNHDSGACLFEDGRLVFAVNEERLNRNKMTRIFPSRSIGHCEEHGGGASFVVASHMTPISFLRLFNKRYAGIKSRSQFSYLLNLYMAYQALLRRSGMMRLESAFSKAILSSRLRSKDITLVDHHECHAYSAYCSSGLRDVLVVTADAMGDGLSLTVSTDKDDSLQKIYEEYGSSAIGTYYSRITEMLGFTAIRHEGKVLGLAATGDPAATSKIFNRLLHREGRGFNSINHLLPYRKTSGSLKRLKSFSREDIAAGLQKNLEEEFTSFVGYWMRETGRKKVCLAGGLFANVRLNQKIHEISDEIFIFPHMGDGGLAVGAGLAYLKPAPRKMDDIYLGPSYSSPEIENILRKRGVTSKRSRNISRLVALELSRGKTVARFSGRMEFGPRSLGNRSILQRPDGLLLNQVLNKRLKREDFMPFAPSVLKIDAGKCFENISGAEHAAKFMTITFDCTDWMKKHCPGVVHADGTARPQFVEEKDNPGLYRILAEFKSLTGLPCILNTSFNMHEEPIVCSPEDALKTFRSSGIDFLAIEDMLVEK